MSPPDPDGLDGPLPGLPFPFAKPRRRLPEEGDLEVFVGDEQDALPVDTGRWQLLAEQVLREEGVAGEAELSLLFVDEQAIADLNRRFMEKEGPTDVLAFPLEDDLVEPGRFPDSGTTGPLDPRARTEATLPPLLLGDVVICPAVAARNAPEHRSERHDGTVEDELALLVVHGVLHVLGHDHAEPGETARMQAREQELLDRYHRPPAAGAAG
jgi:probable rRNA maturation factor